MYFISLSNLEIFEAVLDFSFALILTKAVVKYRLWGHYA